MKPLALIVSSLRPEESAYFAGAAGAGAGAVVCAGACLMEEELTGVFTAKEAQMLNTQMTMARVHVAFSMKSVVLR